METEQYLKQIIKKESINSDSSEAKAMQEERQKIDSILTNFFDSRPVIRYAGSYKKGTMVRGSYDLDIVCYFKHDDSSSGKTLEEIFNNVKTALSNDYSIITKRSALRLYNNKNVDFHIDVVPGRFVDDSQKDAFLHQTEGGKKFLKTNLDVHIDHIKDSGLINTIKLVKIWKKIFALDNVKTFVLELLVVKVLDKKTDENGLSICLESFFKELSNNIYDISVEDPANSGNDLEALFNSSIKDELYAAAVKTVQLITNNKWEDVFGPVNEVTQDYTLNALKGISSGSNSGPKPWFDI